METMELEKYLAACIQDGDHRANVGVIIGRIEESIQSVGYDGFFDGLLEGYGEDLFWDDEDVRADGGRVIEQFPPYAPVPSGKQTPLIRRRVPRSPRGLPPFNQIPAEGRIPCLPILVAFAKGSHNRSPYSLRNTLRRVREHLILCQDTNRVVVLITNVWDEKHFEESRGDLGAYDQIGVEFLGFLASDAGLSKAQIPLGLPMY